METNLSVLLVAAISISVLHTLTGPDHYIPFIAIGKAKNWSLKRTIFWTITCGIGHVLSSVLLALGGVALGFSLSKLNWFEEVRGGLAGWALFLFGLVFLIIGLYQAYRNKRHKHFDVYDSGEVYVYDHKHDGNPIMPSERKKVTPWVLLIIFLLGPCEPMIPLLTYPAILNSTSGIILITATFLFFTLLMMVLMVVLGYYGYSLIKTEFFEKYMNAIAGGTILICGAGMIFLGW
ncbi:Cytochrome C biogenesis protein transmembrane region [Salegentibacter holothuriorum]|uniref:Cytochrome C biogenesis protein transmembrane region n=1 Tax=Salegentibacter holothuriorum TaxID=241145 RepID=A0A1T5D980_9FLAO|nr:hypothetical protein [Salegentibacter holothuriorum]SKB68328.1 Cytochrome C biogenesis protein transmembrane region [Salegentibacter holothuriorum]